jgi:4'-phosphopantetheinyl transferase
MNRDDGEAGSLRDAVREPSLLEWRPGSLSLKLSPDDVRVCLVDFDLGLSEEDVETAEPGPELALLSEEEKERAARFVRARDRRRFVRCRAALREILGGILGESPGSLRLRATGKGKPELDLGVSSSDRGDRADLRFNVSHSAELGLIAVCRGRELGVDLERVRPISEATRIVASFFSPTELHEFASIPDEAKALAFVRGWTRKEAILKGLGVGLSGLSVRYETGFGRIELEARFAPAAPAPRVEEWQLWESAPRPGWVAALAVRVPVTTGPRLDVRGAERVVASRHHESVH